MERTTAVGGSFRADDESRDASDSEILGSILEVIFCTGGVLCSQRVTAVVTAAAGVGKEIPSSGR
jgi:hypothetical protein